MRRTFASTIAVVVLLAGGWLVYAAAQGPAASETSPSAAATMPGQNVKDILSDLDETTAQLDAAAPPDTSLVSDPAVRAKAAPAMLPLLQKLDGILTRLAAAQPNFADDVQANRHELFAMRALLGDKGIEQTLETEKAGNDPVLATQADLALSSVDWWNHAHDAAAQTKVLDHLETVAKREPKNDAVTLTLLKLSKLGPASPELAKRSRDVATAMDGKLAAQLKANAAEEAKYMAPFKDKIGKPLSLSLKTIDGKTINTADLKGKVVVIDVWATWCGPCRAEMPEMAEVYKEKHAKGLEIIGISADNQLADLQEYLKKNPDVSWPMVYSQDQQLIRDLNVSVFPTKLFIDKQGILRDVRFGVTALEPIVDPLLKG